MSVELKSPYPQADKIPVHYKLPKWYILQILIHMFMTHTQLNLYGCCGPKSVVAIECTFDDNLWVRIWEEIKDLLDKRKPEFCDDFDNYIQNHTELIGEVPIVTTDVNENEFQ